MRSNSIFRTEEEMEGVELLMFYDEVMFWGMLLGWLKGFKRLMFFWAFKLQNLIEIKVPHTFSKISKITDQF